MTTETAIPSKLELLLEMGNVQTRFAGALAEANIAKTSNNFAEANHWFEAFHSAGLEYLRLAELHNHHYPNPVEITSVVLTLLNGLSVYADVLQSSGQLADAEEKRNTIVELTRQYLGSEDMAEVERGRAGSLISQGRFNEALTALASARDYFQVKGDTLKLARVTLDMVDLLQWLGDYDRAQAALKDAQRTARDEITKAIPQQDNILESVLGDIGSIFSGQGDPGEARHTTELYRIATELDYYQGLVSKFLQDWKLAEDCFRKVLPEYAKLGVAAAIDYQLASIELGRGRSEEALAMVEALEPTFHAQSQLRAKLGSLLRLKGAALLELGSPEKALSVFNEGAVDIERDYFDPDVLWRLQAGKGEALKRLGRRSDALAAYRSAADTVDQLRKAPLGYRLDSLYLRDKLDLFRSAIGLCVDMNDSERCAQLMEMVKSRTLTTILGSGEKSSTSPELAERFEALTRKLDQLEYQGFKEGNAAAYRDQRQSLLQERAELLEQLRYSDPRWRTLTAPDPFNVQHLQTLLQQNGQAALSLFLDQDRIVTVLFTGEESSVDVQLLAPDIIERLRGYAKNLQQEEPDRAAIDASAGFYHLGAKHLISESLLDKALKHNGLIVAPHSILHLLPWAGLIYRKKRLFQYCPVAVLPNLNCVPALDIPLAAQPKAALFGPPDYTTFRQMEVLPNSLAEVQSVAALYQDGDSLYGLPLTGDSATSEAFWPLLEELDSGLLHIACHGTIEPFEPMNSGLLLADAKIDAAEIARAHIAPAEIVLSACSSGWRPAQVQNVELVGDDILGLPGAFLEGGAKAVLVSIPPANDRATERFMQHYHRNRLLGHRPMEALQATQKAMLESEFAPYKWVGFTLYGCQ